MPSLDRLNAKLGGPTFEVVALSIDRDPALVEPFYQEFGVQTLHGYFDTSAKVSNILRAPGVPATLLIDQEGREIGHTLGPAAWDSPQEKTLVERDRKSTRLNSSHVTISYAVYCLKKKTNN